jgi:hypothetical protein
VSVRGLLLVGNFVDMWKADSHEFESLFVCVEPAPFFQGVFKVQTKSQALFAIAVHLTFRVGRAAVNVHQAFAGLSKS